MADIAVIGRYWPGTSPLHRMDARAKLLLALALMAVVFVAQSFWGLAVCAAFVFGFFKLAGIPLRSAFKSIAPLAFIVCADAERAWKRPVDGMVSTAIDASITCDHMMIEATDLGLGSVWICAFDPAGVREAFNLPASLVPVNILVVGHAADEWKSPERHAVERIPVQELVTKA